MSVAIRPVLGPGTVALLLAALLLVTVDGAPRLPSADDSAWTFSDVVVAFEQVAGQETADSRYDVNHDGRTSFQDVVQIFVASRR